MPARVTAADPSLAHTRDCIIAEAARVVQVTPADRRIAASASLAVAQRCIDDGDYTAAAVLLDEAQAHLRSLREGR